MLISISELLGRSWRFGTSHWKSLVPYMLWLFLPNVLLSMCGFLALLMGSFGEVVNTISIVLLAILVLLNAILGIWVTLALTYAAGHGVSSGMVPQWREAFINTKQFIIPTIVVSIITGLIFFVGTIAFIIPGIIFTGWYLFVVYEVLFDNHRGMDALRSSKALVVGRWWQTVIRFFAPVAVYALFAFAIEAIILLLLPLPPGFFYQQLVRNIVQGLVSGISAPFVVATTVLLYVNLKQTPPTPSSKPLEA